MQNSVSIRILGQEYKVRTRGDHDYVQALSKYINDMVADVQRQGNAVTTMELMAVVMLNMADEVRRTQSELESLKKTIKTRMGQLIDHIDSRLR